MGVEETGGFLGRADDVQAVERGVADGARVLTILGPGGMGKTTLARRVLAGQGSDWFCDVSEAQDGPGLAEALGRTFGVELAGEPGEDARRLRTALASHAGSIALLDNFEQLVPEGVPLIIDLAALGAVTFIVTSRVPLGIAAELTYELGPLTLRRSRPGASDAARLFLDRAARARPGFSPPPEELVEIEALVAQLDGIPLAIELAAAQMDLLSVRALRERLGRGQRATLTDTRRRPRHRSVDAAIEQSWHRLDPQAQHMLGACTSFAGSFSADVAEAVAGGGDGLAPLRALRRGSLLQTVEVGGDLRFAVFDTIRGFARARIADDAWRGFARRHAETFARRAGPDRGAAEAGDRAALTRLRQDRDNLRRAASRCLDELDAPELALEILVALGPVVEVEGGSVELRERLGAALDAPGTGAMSVDDRTKARALVLRAGLWASSGEPDRGDNDLARAREIAQAVGDPGLELRALRALTARAIQALHLDLAESFAARGRELAQLHPELEPALDHYLAVVRTIQGRMDEAISLGRRALRSGPGLAWRDRAAVLRRLAVAYIEAAQHADAELCVEELSRVAESLDSAPTRAVVTGLRALSDHDRGRLESAIERYDAAATLYRRTGHPASADGCERYAAIARLEAGLGAAPGLLDRGGATAYHDALFRAFHALEAARRGAQDTSRRSLEAARAALPQHGADAAHGVVEVLAVCVELALGTRGASARAAEVIRDVSAGEPSLRSRSLDLRIALRFVPGDAPAASAHTTLEVAPDGSSFSLPEQEAVRFSARSPLRRLLAALADHASDAPGRALPHDALLAAGWPGERMGAKSAEARLRVSVSRLRKAGLGPLLETTEGGYLLRCRIRRPA